MERFIHNTLDVVCNAIEDGSADAQTLQGHHETLYAIGQTAWFLGGKEAMLKLVRNAESETGNKAVGRVTNEVWHGIGDWWA